MPEVEEEEEVEEVEATGFATGTGTATGVVVDVVGTDVDEPVAAAEGVALRLAIVWVGGGKDGKGCRTLTGRG